MGLREGLGVLARVRRSCGAAAPSRGLPLLRLDRHGRRGLRERPPRRPCGQPVPPLALRGEAATAPGRERARSPHRVPAPRGRRGAPRARAGPRPGPHERRLGPRPLRPPQVPVLGRLGLGRVAPGVRPLREHRAHPRRHGAARRGLDDAGAPRRRVPRRRRGAPPARPRRPRGRARRGAGRLRRRGAHGARTRPGGARAVRACGLLPRREAAPLVAERLRRTAALPAFRRRGRAAHRAPDRPAPARGRPHARQGRRAVRGPRERRPRLREGRGLDPVRRAAPPRG